MAQPVQPECTTAFLCGLLAFNITFLIATLTTVPLILDNFYTGLLYTLCLHLVVASFAARLFYKVSN